MIPDLHPQPRTVERPDLARSAAWSPGDYAVGDGRLEKWLIDQLMLSAMPVGEQLRILHDLTGILLKLRAARAAGAELAAAVRSGVPPDQTRDWRVIEVEGTFQVWRCGERAWAVQVWADADGAWRWKAGHSFRPFAACHARKNRGRTGDADYCLRYASVLEPRCLQHAERAFVRNLVGEDLVATQSAEAAAPLAEFSE
jgi:hypothetical protein